MKKTKIVIEKPIKRVKVPLYQLNPNDKELDFLTKVLIDIREKNGLHEGKQKKDLLKLKNKDIYFDIDNTLILFDNFIERRKDKLDLVIHLKTNDDVIPVNISIAPHRKHINMLKELSKRNRIIAWSFAGKVWASEVCKQLKLNKYISLYLTKPEIYFDDLDVTEWIGDRIWFKDE